MKKKYLNGLVVLFYFFIFVLLYFNTLNFNYVEGDDASTILYHLCGRNSEIQKPYASYNSGLDYILSLSNLKTEVSLREFTVFISFVSGFLILVLFFIFVTVFFENENTQNNKKSIYFFLAVPFIIPDIFFHSLIINSTNISFVFLLSSLIAFVKFLKTRKQYWLILSTIFFAISIPFRWTMLVSLPLYFGLALYFFPIQNYSKETYHLFLKILIANISGIFLSFFFINLTGYNLKDIYQTVMQTTRYLEKSDQSILSMFAIGSAFFTPALCFLLGLGIFKIFELRKQNPKIIFSYLAFFSFSILPFYIVGFIPSYKFLITILPAILVLINFGFDYLTNRNFLKIFFIIILITPWFIGIQVDTKQSFCGPGFELNTNKITSKIDFKDLKNPDKRVKFTKITPKFDSGMYMPMLEGPRPLYGYFYVFFEKGWKRQIDIFTNERDKLFSILDNDSSIVYLQDRRTAYFQCDLYRLGYETNTDFIFDKNILFRDYKNENKTIRINVIPDISSKSDWIYSFFIKTNNSIVFRSSYSSDILRLNEENLYSLKIIGPFTILKNKKNN